MYAEPDRKQDNHLKGAFRGSRDVSQYNKLTSGLIQGINNNTGSGGIGQNTLIRLLKQLIALLSKLLNGNSYDLSTAQKLLPGIITELIHKKNAGQETSVSSGSQMDQAAEQESMEDIWDNSEYISDYFGEASNNSEDISNASEGISDTSEDIWDNSEYISDYFGEASNNSGEMSDTSGEMSDTSGEMSDTSGEMSDTSGEMSDTSGEMSDTSGEMSDTSGEMSDTSGEIWDNSEEMSDRPETQQRAQKEDEPAYLPGNTSPTSMTEPPQKKTKLSPHELPPNWKWSHGKAKEESRHAVVRHWIRPSQKLVEHTALSLKDTEKNQHDYLSWDFSNDALEKRLENNIFANNPIVRKMYYSLGKLEASPKESYAEDKEVWVPSTTAFNLEAGEKAREAIAAGSKASSLQKTAEYKPFPYQKKSAKNNKWQRRAQKTYLPIIGHSQDKKTGASNFNMFGLFPGKIQQSMEDQKKNQYYQRASCNLNCSGVVYNTLAQSGSQHFLSEKKPRFAITPGYLHTYSDKLLNKMEDLNNKADFITEIAREKNCSPCSFQTASENLTEEISKKQLPYGDIKKLKQLNHSLKSLSALESRSDGQDSQAAEMNAYRAQPQVIKLVKDIAETHNKFKDNPQAMQALKPALSAFLGVRSQLRESLEP